jgi:hypothetical protein
MNSALINLRLLPQGCAADLIATDMFTHGEGIEERTAQTFA